MDDELNRVCWGETVTPRESPATSRSEAETPTATIDFSRGDSEEEEEDGERRLAGEFFGFLLFVAFSYGIFRMWEARETMTWREL